MASGIALNSAVIEPHQDETRKTVTPMLLKYWQIVLRWRFVIIGIIIASLAAGLVATLLMTPQYSAGSRIEISRDQKKITNVEGLEAADAGRDLEFYQTQYSLLRARSLAERVVRKLKLANDESFFEAHGESADSGLQIFEGGSGSQPLSANRRAERERKAVKLLLDHIAISPIRGSALIDINYSSGNAEFSAKVANTWTEQFIAASNDRRYASTADARQFLEGRLADLRARLESSERELVNYSSSKGIVTLSQSADSKGAIRPDATLVLRDLEVMNEELAKATANRIMAASRVRNAGNSQEALDNLTISNLRQKRAEAVADYQRMLVQFEPEYPAARALADQIRSIEASIRQEEGRVSGTRTAEYNEAVKREGAMREKIDALKARLNTEQSDSIQYNIYQREADTNRQLYEALLQRYKEIGVAGVGANNISIVDRAEIPQKPSAPSLIFNLLIALFAGIVLSTLATLALDQIDEGIREPNQVNELLSVPLLGTVPDIDTANVLEQVRDPKSTVSEAYLSIRSSLSFSTDHGLPKSFLFTSTRPAEGKSTSSFAVATVLGRTGKRVLLIDADMRSPSIHGFVDLKNDVGLSNFLTGHDNVGELVKKTPIKGLDVMSAGLPPPSAAELLSSTRMATLVKQALQDYDHVIVDAPPVLALADAPLLAQTVEGCIFVVESGGVAVRGIQASLDRLRAVQAHIFGVILSKVQQRQAGYGYGYGYGGFEYGEKTATSGE